MQNVPIVRPGLLGNGEDEEGALMYGMAEPKSPLRSIAYIHAYQIESCRNQWKPCNLLYFDISYSIYGFCYHFIS